jgi:hypothetical protein
MTLDEVKKLTPLDRLLYWVKERESIRRAKEAGKPAPWTDDPILQTTYFTNVRREDDKVTRWYATNIREPLRSDPRVVFATIAFRWFNWPPTGDTLTLRTEPHDRRNLLTNWDTTEAIKRLEFERDRMEVKVFSGAFNISNSGSTKPKINRVCEDYIQPVWDRRTELQSLIEEQPTLRKLFNTLRTYPGLGGSGFMAAQIVADLKYTSFLDDVEETPDWWTFCCLGPGSKRGLNILLDRPVGGPVPKDCRTHIEDLRHLLNKQFSKWDPFHAQDVQNCLCEYSKYSRMLLGDGRSKRTYNGRG